MSSATQSIFIPVRLGSTRLPEKALVDVCGQPALARLIDRLKVSQRAKEIVICTTTDASDDPLEGLANDCGVACFRGSRDDLIQRLSDAAAAHGVDELLCVDGDDVMLDPDQVDQVGAFIQESQAHFVRMNGMPFGCNPIALNAAALAKVCAEKTTDDTATGWGVYFENNPAYNVADLPVTAPALHHPEIRLTLDYPEDLALIVAIHEGLGGDKPLRIKEVIEFLLANPVLLEINQGLEEKYWQHVAENQADA